MEPPAVAIPGVHNLGIEASTEIGSIDIVDRSSAEIAIAQQADRDIGVIHAMMSSNTAKPPWKEIDVYSAACKSLWHHWKHLVCAMEFCIDCFTPAMVYRASCNSWFRTSIGMDSSGWRTKA